ncbi:hypothetical protein HYH03_017838 [Edaphochlamys debaryana]|uniref:Uncharacterized protein n=1 Tax=Edaphochlamys debaryana TaxID=47281 RepID=A0A835XJ94_9CHLO|nr:hypothetical protein HYH03_017838 [Edaphochlamys debaryana]|eukprot:KAG2483291.1 hypothetical protein HYH03_017838 [Edaphochlamys debaryana]
MLTLASRTLLAASARAPAAACAPAAAALQRAARGTHSSGTAAVGGHMADAEPEAKADALKHRKEQSLKGETPSFVPNTEGWHETLASVSEAVVKADKAVDDDAASSPQKLQELQQHTINVRGRVVQQLHHSGEQGMPAMPKHEGRDVSASPAHSANLEHTSQEQLGQIGV